MLNFTQNQVIYLDGAMGTMLQKAGVPIGKIPEALNLTHPDTVIEIHKAYLESGSQVIYSNTFSANRYKLKGSQYTPTELVTAGVKNAKLAVKGTEALVALDIGPIGELLQPNGNLTFEEAYDMFSEMLTAGAKAGADLVVFETMTDLLEMKAAVLAAKENTSLPIFCTMTFEQNGRTFTGVTIPSMAVTLEGLGVDAVGINCSLGPKEILPLAKELCEWTSLPVIIKANAGLPNLTSNTYDITPEEFADTMEEYLSFGVSIIGGCCGTTPDYIKAVKTKLAGKQLVLREKKERSVLCSASQTVVVDGVKIVVEN